MSTLAIESNAVAPIEVGELEPFDPFSLHKRRRKMTLEEFMNLPDDGVERRLRYGYLIEGGNVSRRARVHAACTAAVTVSLGIWHRAHPELGGEVANGDAGFLLSKEKKLTVGADVAYVSAEIVARRGPETTMYDGPPVLAVEVLSPSDELQDIAEKLNDYLSNGTLLVWMLDPFLKTVMAHRPGVPPQLFTIADTITAEPLLPGLAVPVREFFGA